MPDEQRDFFISFNSADEAYAKAISDALRAEGFTTFFHPDDLEPGGHIPKWMNDALRSSRQMLALCSPEYMSEGAVYSEAERYAWFWRDTRGEKFKLIPVVLKEVEFPPLLAIYKRLMATNTTPAEAAAAIVAALKKSEEIKEREVLRGTQPNESVRQPAYVHTTRLPETGYERLVGREAELQLLDNTWLDAKINILSLIAEGGAGKSALVNEWIKRMQAYNYPGAETVLGWSFFSQGTTERATSAEEFLNWALEKLGITLATTSASAKADAIAEAMMRRRVLLLLDGVEPLQHGPGPLIGQLKDSGLRALLRRFAATPPGAAHGLIVLTSRLAIRDIMGWRDDAAPVADVYKLSDEAGAALLHDNGVAGTDRELRAAAHDFGGHPLALGLLASFVKETKAGDVRRRDHIRAYLADPNNPRHDHAKRIMESYEKEWLAERPILLAIMYIVGLFDRPASGDCLVALRAKPAIERLTGEIVKLEDGEWRRAVARLREVRLLAPVDPAAPDALDAHPLVREWFGEQLKGTNEVAWKAAHGRLYKYLKDTTREGETPTLEDLAPLYQAVAHGCRAGLHQEALDEIYRDRICRHGQDGDLEFYSLDKLGAHDNDRAAFSWFFEKAYETPITSLTDAAQNWVLSMASYLLQAQGRLAEALPTQRQSLFMNETAKRWGNAARSAANLSEIELTLGKIADANASAERAVIYADDTDDDFLKIFSRSLKANALAASGRRQEAVDLFIDAERRQKKWQPDLPLLYSYQGYHRYDFLLANGEYDIVVEQTDKTLQWAKSQGSRLDVALHTLILGRAHLGVALRLVDRGVYAAITAESVDIARSRLGEALEGLRVSGTLKHLPSALIARSCLRRCLGDWAGAKRDLDEVNEIAESGLMRLGLCDMALKLARLVLARVETFAPLNGLVGDSPPKPEALSEVECVHLRAEASKQLTIASGTIEKCGYRRRDEELDELRSVLNSGLTFARLPPRV